MYELTILFLKFFASSLPGESINTLFTSSSAFLLIGLLNAPAL